MYKTYKLLNKTNKVIPNTDCPEDLANDFSRLFIGKVNKIRNEVDVWFLVVAVAVAVAAAAAATVPCCM